LVRPTLKYWSAWWDPHREGQINALDRERKKAAQFTNHTKVSDWGTLAQRRTTTRLCAIFKAYSGERALEAIRDMLRGLTIWVGLIMFGKLGTGNKERISGIIQS